MTFREAILKHLEENGMFPQQAEAVFDRLKAHDNSSPHPAMGHHWEDHVEGYPKPMISVILMSARSEALKWIDECMPQAWYRPMFLPAKEREALLKDVVVPDGGSQPI